MAQSIGSNEGEWCVRVVMKAHECCMGDHIGRLCGGESVMKMK